MSHKKLGLSSLINQVGGRKVTTAQNASQLLAVTGKATNPSLKESVGLGSSSITSQPKEHSIQFGRPSTTNTSSSTQGGSTWKSLLSNAMSGGASGALGSFGGVGSLISGLAGLFGGSSKAQLPPLTLFSLPSSQQQTSYVQADAINAAASNSGPVYTSTSVKSGNAPSSTTNVVDTGAIAAAVKNALLTSNSLSDVIAEL
jgi:hypothetical protein